MVPTLNGSRSPAGMLVLAIVSLALLAACGTDPVTEVPEDDGGTSAPSDAGAEPDAGLDGGPDAGSDAGVDGGDPDRCSGYSPSRNVYFGDLHVHTGYSQDAFQSFGNRTGPSDAYDFALGASIPIPSRATAPRTAQLDRKLDFMAVTDHSEALGGAGTLQPTGKADAWSRTRAAAENYYDRTRDCSFTTFPAYEYSRAPNGGMLHRNVIFRDDTALPQPFASGNGTEEQLWTSLESTCNNAGTGCEALTISHNPNRSNGTYFAWPPNTNLPHAQYAALRSRVERLAEVFQYKGNSECRVGVGTNDPLCDEQYWDFQVNCAATPDDPTCSPANFVRNALRKGLEVEGLVGVNPFKFGLMASTDTHNTTGGAIDDYKHQGHQGLDDADVLVRLDPSDKFYYRNPGGLVAVWAEENRRDALFDALKRREVYGTSGTRIKVRMFAGWDLPPGLCGRSDLVEAGYANGVPMGSDLPPRVGDASPTILLWALKDPDGRPLQHAQIVKGWHDPVTHQLHEKIYEIAGNPGNGASVDTGTCEPSGAGASELCVAWTDPDFDPSHRAVYYARVFENPSCSSRGWDCLKLPAGSRPAACTSAALAPTLVTKDRAWTSPVWFGP